MTMIAATNLLLILPVLLLLLLLDAGNNSIVTIVHGFCPPTTTRTPLLPSVLKTAFSKSSTSTSAGSSNSGDNNIDNTNDNDINTQVKVCVQQSLPTTLKTPQEARRAWLDYVWEKGGGLPFLRVIPITQESTTALEELETTVQRRRLFPIGMEEEIIIKVEKEDKNHEDNTCCQVQYTVQDGGLLSTEIVPGSHLGTVTFSYAPAAAAESQQTKETKEGSVQLVWDVTYDTTAASRTFIWQAVTKQTITDTCNNFQTAMAVPQLYSRQTMLQLSNNKKKNTSAVTNDDEAREVLQHVMDEWIQFCWKEGAGVPWPIPPIFLQNDDNSDRWIVPPFLKERLVSASIIDSSNSNNGAYPYYAEIQYQVENPSLFTYQVHSHHGRIRFSLVDNDNDSKNNNTDNDNVVVMMNWDIEIRPFYGWSAFVKAFTGAVISCYARNFKCYMQDGADAMVALKPPRGGGTNSQTLWQVPKASYIGGVLEAHLKDQRSTAQQTLAIFQPWTWGRTQDFDDDNEGEEWKDGYLSLE